MTTRLLIAAGGTGGHLFPALAVAQQLQRTAPAAQILFVGGTRGLESRLIPEHGFELRSLSTGRFKGRSWAERVRTAAGLGPVLWRAHALLGAFGANVVLGAGGYASAPIVVAAALRRIPVILLEQNAVPGMTNRLLARFARHVVTALPDRRHMLPSRRTLQLGNPLRPELVARLQRHELMEARPRTATARLLVLGGSQGARRVNELVCEAVPLVAQRVAQLEVVHQTGFAGLAEVQRAYLQAGIQARVEPFVEDMAQVYGTADLMIGRAGATTIAELMVAGLPALLIPYPFAADDHQAANAEELVQAGAALMRRESELTGHHLAQLVVEVLQDRARLARMSRAMRALARPDAAAAVVALIQELVQSRPSSM